MILRTTRFGVVDFQPDDILLFPRGLIGFEDFRHWILMADADNDSVAWLHSMARPDVAMAVVSPRKFVPDYSVHIARSQLESLKLSSVTAAYVLVVLSRNDQHLTVNLRAPILVNLDRRLGEQVMTTDEQPIQWRIAEISTSLRKSA